MKTFDILGCELKCTCGECPEQYEVFRGGKQIGYLRLRHGYFTAFALGDHVVETVFEAAPRGDGRFKDDEREGYLVQAVLALLEKEKTNA